MEAQRGGQACYGPRGAAVNVQRSKPTRLRPLLSWVSSLAFHAALIGLVSLRLLRGDPPVEPVLIGEIVTVDVAPRAPLTGPKTARPGGGAPARRINHSSIALTPTARRLPVRQAEAPSPRLAAIPPQEPRGREAAPAVTVDAIAGPSRLNAAHGKEPDATAPAAGAGASGTGPGSRGGPGGSGAGRGGGAVPVVTGEFAFGKDTRAAFKGVACFFEPGVLRIADIRRCTPVATFYTNTFNIPERQEAQGFPGITARANWFLIEYTGVFTVGKDGSYEFRLHSDDGSYLIIDGATVIENDGKHGPESRSGTIQLKAGEHQLRILYAQTIDRMALQLFVQVPGALDEQLFTPRI